LPWGKRRSLVLAYQHSIPPLNLEELKEEKGVEFAAEVTNRFTALEAAHDEVTPEDLWQNYGSWWVAANTAYSLTSTRPM